MGASPPTDAPALRAHVFDEVCGGLRHAPRGAGRAEAAALAREGDQEVVIAVVAACRREAAGEDAALEEAAQFALDVPSDRRTVGCSATI